MKPIELKDYMASESINKARSAKGLGSFIAGAWFLDTPLACLKRIFSSPLIARTGY